MIAMEINLTIVTCNWKQESCITEIFRNRFFDSNPQHKTQTVIRHLLSSLKQPTTPWPKAPDFTL